MRGNARAYFEKHLTEDQNFAQLMRIYTQVVARNAQESTLGAA
jgi:hypothetical protein